jgi:hypothetical protein
MKLLQYINKVPTRKFKLETITNNLTRLIIIIHSFFYVDLGLLQF